MGDKTKIEWTRGDDGTLGATWNPVTGCTKVSEGCRNCYIARTLPRQGQDPWKVVLHPDRLAIPLHWRRPRKIFISLTDIFHKEIPDNFLDRLFTVMAMSRRHTFQILTKRPERMLAFCKTLKHRSVMCGETSAYLLPNVWLGVSCEDQKTADERIPILLQTPAAVRFVSYEPALGPVDFMRHTLGFLGSHLPIHWLICGGESGPGARPMHPDWARAVRDQCVAAGVPFFFKQWGEWGPRVLHWDVDEVETAGPSGIPPWIEHEGNCCMMRVGKKAAGRLLDGREWNEFPAGRHEAV